MLCSIPTPRRLGKQREEREGLAGQRRGGDLKSCLPADDPLNAMANATHGTEPEGVGTVVVLLA